MAAIPDHFERLGLPRRFSVDNADVERRFLALSRELHPDFHHGGSEAEQRASLDLTAAVNEAYRVLSDPYRRADHLLSLIGGPTAEDEKGLDPAFLMEMMDLRERIESARATQSGRDGIAGELAERCADIARTMHAKFKSASATPNLPLLAAIRKQLNAWKTLLTQLRDLNAD